MAEDRICGVCSAWMCRSDDAWCGYCGKGCAQLELSAIPDVLQVRQIAPPILFKLKNASCSNLEVSDAEVPEWLSLRARQLTIQAGQTAEIWADASTLQMKQATAKEVVFTTRAGKAKVPLMVLIEHPSLTVVPSEIVSWIGTTIGTAIGPATGVANVARRNVTKLLIKPDAGALRVLGVRPELPRQLAANGFKVPFYASAQTPIAVDVHVDDERLLPLHWPPSLIVDYEGPHGPENVAVTIQVAVRQPPQLLWLEKDEPPRVRYYTERQRLELTFANQHPGGADGGGGDNADLLIESVTLLAPSGAEVGIERKTPLPCTVKGGAKQAVEFDLNLERATKPGEAQGKLIHLQLEVKTNNLGLSVKVPLRVEPLRLFEGVVAIDFGSSNTCCAMLQPGGEPVFLRLDEQGSVSPTIVRYIDMKKTPPTVEIGASVKELAATSDEVAASTVRSLKQRLGLPQEAIDVRPKNSEDWQTRRASEAAADYLREVRRTAESRENTIFWDFVLTHPARCPLRQYRRLQDALKQAFGLQGKRIQYLQEPIAALVPYFIDRAREAKTLQYTVASFDLGGGTTDVAVVRVEQTCLAEGDIEIRPEIVSCQGVGFGGENLTDFLEAELQRRCKIQLNAEEPGSMLVSEALYAAAKPQASRNSAELRRAAEQWKASIGEAGGVREPTQLTLDIRGKDGKTDLYPFDFARLCHEGGSSLRTEFESHVAERVREMAGLLRPEGYSGMIDVIQLSGMTAFLPIVGDTLRKIYPNAWILRAPDPKECVVRGACLWRSTRNGSLRLLLPAKQRTTSSIGLWRSQTSPFKPILPMDTEIPAGGLEREFAAGWDGFESIVLWENVGPDREDPVSLRDRELLTRLGSWRPKAENRLVPPAGEMWPIRLRLTDLQVSVDVIAPGGQIIACESMQGGNDR